MRVSPLSELVTSSVPEYPVNVVQLHADDAVAQIIQALRREHEMGRPRVILAFPPTDGEIAYLPYVFDQLSRFKRQTGLNILVVAPPHSPAERFAQPGHFVVLPTLEECAALLASLKTGTGTEMADTTLPPLDPLGTIAETAIEGTTTITDERPVTAYPADQEEESILQSPPFTADRLPADMPLEPDAIPPASAEHPLAPDVLEATIPHSLNADAASDLDTPAITAATEPSAPDEQLPAARFHPVSADAGVSLLAAGRPVARPPRRRTLHVLVALLILLLLGAGSVMAIYGGPQGAMAQVLQTIGQDRATITFVPITHPVQVTSIITASPSVSFDPALRLLPLRLLSASSPMQSATAPATGTKTIPATPATGTLTFSNYNFSQPITIPAGTSFRATNGLNYVTTASVTVPAAQLGANGPVPGQATVNAQAQQPGAAGNIGSGAINTVYGNSVVVQNTAPFTGGQDTQHLHVVQQSDIDSLKQRLIAQLQPQVQQALAVQITSTDIQIGSFSFTQQIKSSAQAGDTANSVTVTLSIQGSGLTYNRDQYVQLVQVLLAQKAAALGPDFQLVPHQWSYNPPELISQARNHTLYFQVRAAGWAVYQFSRRELTHLAQVLAGQPDSSARSYLQQRVPNLDPATVTIALPWGITRLPGSPADITIQVRAPRLPTNAP